MNPLPPPEKLFILIEKNKFLLTLYRQEGKEDNKLRKAASYPIGIGAIGYATPEGIWKIKVKARCPEWMVPDSDWAIDAGLIPGTIVPGCTPSNPLIARWIGITPTKQGIGIHGTSERDSMGQRASHGCIRMLEEDVIELYSQVPKGTQVMIAKEVDW